MVANNEASTNGGGNAHSENPKPLRIIGELTMFR